jgi:hypothetical protein
MLFLPGSDDVAGVMAHIDDLMKIARWEVSEAVLVALTARRPCRGLVPIALTSQRARRGILVSLLSLSWPPVGSTTSFGLVLKQPIAAFLLPTSCTY